MIGAKEKAKGLVDKFASTGQLNIAFMNDYQLEVEKIKAKKCALICVEEISKAIDFDWMEVQNLDREHAYWDKVIDEIKKL